jgi:hypothetical protein
MKTPTSETYNSLEEAYNFYNRELFQDRLPACLLTLQRKSKRTYGYFSPSRFEDDIERNSDELAMNPMHFKSRDIDAVLATLVHEMTHVEQEHFGKPSRNGYHNKEWGTLMLAVGLHPSNTGQPGGKMTGQQMTHYVIAGGAFERATRRLIARGFKLKWGEAGPKDKDAGGDPNEPEKEKSNRVRFGCAGCKAKAWGKPSLKLICGKCKLPMLPR